MTRFPTCSCFLRHRGDHFDHRELEMGAEAQIVDPDGSGWLIRLRILLQRIRALFESRGGAGRSDTRYEAGRLLFFSFGPLYRASYGLHAMHSITVPFCQYLWPRAVLDDHIGPTVWAVSSMRRSTGGPSASFANSSPDFSHGRGRSSIAKCRASTGSSLSRNIRRVFAERRGRSRTSWSRS